MPYLPAGPERMARDPENLNEHFLVTRGNSCLARILFHGCQSSVRLHEQYIEVVQFLCFECIRKRIDVSLEARRQICIRTCCKRNADSLVRSCCCALTGMRSWHVFLHGDNLMRQRDIGEAHLACDLSRAQLMIRETSETVGKRDSLEKAFTNRNAVARQQRKKCPSLSPRSSPCVTDLHRPVARLRS